MPREEKNNREGFGLPEDYFARGAARLAISAACLAELQNHKMLLSLKGSRPFALPENYFEAAMEVELIAKLPQGNTQLKSPGDSFGRQADQGTMSTALTDRAGSSGAADFFQTPPDYFERSAARLRKEAGPGSKIIRLIRHRGFYLAAAASLFIVTGTWIYRSFMADDAADCLTIACLEKKDIVGSGVIEYFTEDELMMMVDENELARALEIGSAEPGPPAYVDSIDGKDE